MGKPKPDPKRVHRESVTEAPPAGKSESTQAHDTGASARWREAFAEDDKAGSN